MGATLPTTPSSQRQFDATENFTSPNKASPSLPVLPGMEGVSNSAAAATSTVDLASLGPLHPIEGSPNHASQDGPSHAHFGAVPPTYFASQPAGRYETMPAIAAAAAALAGPRCPIGFGHLRLPQLPRLRAERTPLPYRRRSLKPWIIPRNRHLVSWSPPFLRPRLTMATVFLPRTSM